MKIITLPKLGSCVNGEIVGLVENKPNDEKSGLALMQVESFEKYLAENRKIDCPAYANLMIEEINRVILGNKTTDPAKVVGS